MSNSVSLLLLPGLSSPSPPSNHPRLSTPSPHHGLRLRLRLRTSTRSKRSLLPLATTGSRSERASSETEPTDPEIPVVECVGTGLDTECFVADTPTAAAASESQPLLPEQSDEIAEESLLSRAFESGLLISPFFFWGTAMVAMKEVIPKAGPFFVSSFRLIPAGLLVVAFAAAKGRKMPTGALAWISIALFGVIDAACFQGFLTEGLQKTSAGLGSVIIDSQPLTVAVLAALLFGESIGVVGAAGLALGVVGLLLLEVGLHFCWRFHMFLFDKLSFSRIDMSC